MQIPRPLVGLIRNPLSHRNVTALSSEEKALPNLLVRAPRSHDMLREVLAEFSTRGVEYLAIEGGDGTMRDVLTCGDDIFGDDWPPFVILPRGKTNALAADLGLPKDWCLARSMEAAAQGRRAARRPLHLERMRAQGADERGIGSAGIAENGYIANYPSGPVRGFFLGAGAFKLGTDSAQSVHRWRMFGGLAVATTVLLSVLQIIFGRSRNRWRRGTPMALRLRRPEQAKAESFPHVKQEGRDRRFMLLATTLERFPLNARPFGYKLHHGLKLGIIDYPYRWLIALLPLMLFGLNNPALARNGAHRLPIDEAEMDLAESFIMDGETFPPGHYRLREGPVLNFVIP